MFDILIEYVVVRQIFLMEGKHQAEGQNRLWRRAVGGHRVIAPGGGEEEPGNTAQLWEELLLFDVVLEKQSGKGSSVEIEQVSVTHVRSSVGVTESCTE